MAAASVGCQRPCVWKSSSLSRRVCWGRPGICVGKRGGGRGGEIWEGSAKDWVVRCEVEPQEVVSVPRADDVRRLT